jgi:hypothetical protein
MVTELGIINKTALEEFSNPRKTGIGAIGLDKKDKLIDVHLTDGKNDIVIGTADGVAIRFQEQEVRVMGRSAGGVRAIKLEKGDRVVGAVVLRRAGTTILVATEDGFGKRSETEDYRVSHRGGKGIITVKASEKTGKMIAIKEVAEKDDVVIVTTGGIIIRQHASDIRLAGRNTQGVRLIKLAAGDKVSDVAAVPSEDDEPTNGNGSTPKNGGDKGHEKAADDQQSLFDEGDEPKDDAQRAGGEKKSLKVEKGKKQTGKKEELKGTGKTKEKLAEVAGGRTPVKKQEKAGKPAAKKPADKAQAKKQTGKGKQKKK